jgi:penicillin-binding protein 1C
MAGTIALALAITVARLGPPPLTEAKQLSEIVVDREGRLLRAFTTADGRWRLPVEPEEVDRRYLEMLYAFEDRRFHQHRGVDLLAVGRAVMQMAMHGRAVSGGSTLTMQAARLIDRRHDRSLATKWLQMARALQLEGLLSKREILALYLRMAPFGGNLEGVRAASLAYFGKEPRRLSLGEAALLVALPQSPEARRPDRSPRAARIARDRVLMRAALAGVISMAEARRATAQPVPQTRREFPKFAPHLSEELVAKKTGQRIHRLTLDRGIQERLEALARSQAHGLGKRLSVAILAADHSTGEILAHVGSADYLDSNRLGAIDMVDAVRSPGSTLKPMIYGLAFEAGLAHPETFIEDKPVRFGLYQPKNFDENYRGTVTIREALALSLNIPVVKVLDAVGPGRLIGRLRKSGLAPQLPEATAPTLAVALGGLGLTLRELTELYASVANRGRRVKLRHQARTTPDRSAPFDVLSPVASWYIADILKNAPPPAAARAGEIAYKTGTSYGYRDAWAVGFDGRHAVGIWVGRADATSTPGLTGRTAAAPILFDAFKRIAKTRTPLKSPPDGAIRMAGGDLPPPLKRFNEGHDQQISGPFIDPPVRIAFPPDRSEVAVEDAGQPIVLKASGGVLPLTWMIDDAPVGSSRHERSFVWESGSRGFVKVSVIDAKGRVDRVEVRLR